MDRGKDDPHSRMLLRILAGLETGIAGGLIMMGWFLFHATLRGLYWWVVPNLLAAIVYPGRQYRYGFGTVTMVGLAVHLASSGLVGAIFACLFPPRNQARILLVGLIASIGWYYLAFVVLWERINPGIPVSPWLPSMLTGHLAFGVSLSWYPRAFQNLLDHFDDQPVTEICDSTPST